MSGFHSRPPSPGSRSLTDLSYQGRGECHHGPSSPLRGEVRDPDLSGERGGGELLRETCRRQPAVCMSVRRSRPPSPGSRTHRPLPSRERMVVGGSPRSVCPASAAAHPLPVRGASPTSPIKGEEDAGESSSPLSGEVRDPDLSGERGGGERLRETCRRQRAVCMSGFRSRAPSPGSRTHRPLPSRERRVVGGSPRSVCPASEAAHPLPVRGLTDLSHQGRGGFRRITLSRFADSPTSPIKGGERIEGLSCLVEGEEKSSEAPASHRRRIGSYGCAS